MQDQGFSSKNIYENCDSKNQSQSKYDLTKVDLLSGTEIDKKVRLVLYLLLFYMAKYF